LIGERTAERLKMVLGSATEPLEDHKSMLKGQRLAGDGPAMIEVSSAEITQAIDGVLRQIAQAVRAVIERVPPEVAGDLSDQGMVLTGGMALLAGIDARLEAETNLKVRIAESPRQSVAQGLISLYEQPLMLRRVTRNV
jgi:rod shape-determining protein MreB